MSSIEEVEEEIKEVKAEVKKLKAKLEKLEDELKTKEKKSPLEIAQHAAVVPLQQQLLQLGDEKAQLAAELTRIRANTGGPSVRAAIRTRLARAFCRPACRSVHPHHAIRAPSLQSLNPARARAPPACVPHSPCMQTSRPRIAPSTASRRRVRVSLCSLAFAHAPPRY